MDTLAHALWSYIIFHNYELVWWAVLFGTLPDLLSWTVWMLWPKKNGFSWKKKPDLNLIPKWVFTLYGITHSIFFMGIVFLSVFLIYGSIPLFLLSWTIHVLIDIPMHTKDFLPTPFLWPVSDYKFPGFSWANKWFMALNWSVIISLLVYINL